jgi:hypothetical protein
MDTKTILAGLRAERDHINQAIAALEALTGTSAISAPVKSGRKASKAGQKTAKVATPIVVQSSGKRVISPEARQRMALAQQKRWAKKKKAVKAAAKKTAAPAASKKVASDAPKA